MMSPQQFGNEMQHYVLTDFYQTFERHTGLNMTEWCDIVEDSNSIFYSFSYLIEHLFSLIDTVKRNYPCQTFTIKGLTVLQRKDFYVELSKIGIQFTKYKYLDDNRNHCTDICISTVDIWSVPDLRTTPELAIYQHRINVFNTFYSRIENSLTTRIIANGNIIVSLSNFLKFKRIFADTVSSYNRYRYNNINNNYIINNIVYMPNQHTVANSYTTYPIHPQYQPCVSSNTKIKHQLADLIFDIKDHLTDAMYKDILEKITLISP